MPAFSGDELAGWSSGKWDPSPPESVEGVSTDTRSLSAGSLFFALKGRNCDGHELVDEAFERGAAGAVVRKDSGLRSKRGQPLLRVVDTLRALQDIARGYRKDLGIEIVAVTGSVGKSTIKEMTASVLDGVIPSARTVGNWNTEIGVPLSLLATERSARLGVFEIGMSHRGEIAFLCGLLEPSWGIVTNVGPVHLEFFDSVSAIAEEKSELLKCLPPDGAAVLCADDDFFDLMKREVRGRVVTVSMKGDADYMHLRGAGSGCEVMICEKSSGEEFAFKARVPGEHNVLNAMFAIAVARGHAMSWNDIRSGIENYSPLPMRWSEEKIEGVTVVNDAYNANPMSMRASIETFADMKVEGGKWLVLAGMLELGRREREEHIELGRYVVSGDWAGLITVGVLGARIADGAENAGLERNRIVRCECNTEAARVLAEKVAEGDAVLLKGSRAMRLEELREEFATRICLKP